MTVIIKGHRQRVDDQTTFVPAGTKLRFYSGFDVDISQNVTLIALATGAQAAAQETIDGTGKADDVANSPRAVRSAPGHWASPVSKARRGW